MKADCHCFWDEILVLGLGEKSSWWLANLRINPESLHYKLCDLGKVTSILWLFVALTNTMCHYQQMVLKISLEDVRYKEMTQSLSLHPSWSWHTVSSLRWCGASQQRSATSLLTEWLAQSRNPCKAVHSVTDERWLAHNQQQEVPSYHLGISSGRETAWAA